MRAANQLPLDGLADETPAVAVRRSGSLYGVHAYHTKVPMEAITPFIERHTRPGDVVLDPFCGSGMTGVAAGMVGRRAVLNDLSPAAVHIASNYTTPCPPGDFLAAVDRVLDAVGEEIAALYASDEEGHAATVEYVVWSDVRRCPICSAEVVLWHQRENLRSIRCPACSHSAPKAGMPVLGERAVETNLSVGGRRVARKTRPPDLGPEITRERLRWVPDALFDSSRPMWRRGHEDLGIFSAADFYSARNLAGLSALWDAASAESDKRLRSALRFSLTAIANRASRRYQWNAKRPTNVLGGTLYVSGLRYEWNVLSLWKRKTSAVAKLFAARVVEGGAVITTRGSATSLSLADESIDYCFTDPPFGSHIVYSDASLLWEAWLDDLTDRSAEAIVTRSGSRPKSIADYGELLRMSFAEVRRVLKPGGHATVVFQASDPATWSAVYEAAREAGLGFVEATTLSKGQPSFKQVKGQSGGELVAESDVVLTFARTSTAASAPNGIDAGRAVHEAVRAVSETGRRVTAGSIYADVNARLLSGSAEPVGLREVDRLLASSPHGGRR